MTGGLVFKDALRTVEVMRLTSACLIEDSRDVAGREFDYD